MMVYEHLWAWIRSNPGWPYLIVSVTLGMIVSFIQGLGEDEDDKKNGDASFGIIVAIGWPLIAVFLLCWCPFGGGQWLGRRHAKLKRERLDEAEREAKIQAEKELRAKIQAEKELRAKKHS